MSWKKPLSIVLICLFALMLIGAITSHSNEASNDSAYATGRLAGLLIDVVGLIASVRWYLRLRKA